MDIKPVVRLFDGLTVRISNVIQSRSGYFADREAVFVTGASVLYINIAQYSQAIDLLYREFFDKICPGARLTADDTEKFHINFEYRNINHEEIIARKQRGFKNRKG